MSTRSQIPMSDRWAGWFGKPAVALSVATAALLIAAGQATALDCDTDLDAVEYDSSHGDTPDETADWDTDCPGVQDGDPDMGVITDGILIVTDDSATAKAKYCAENLFDDSCDRVQDAVYEFSCRALSMTDNAPVWNVSTAKFVFSCGMSTGTDANLDYDFRVAISLNQGVGFWEIFEGNARWLEVNSVQQVVQIPWNSPNGPWNDEHLFRIEFHNRTSSPTVSLFLDNNPKASLSFAVDELADNNLDDLTILASTSQVGQSSFELMHFRYRIGTTSFDEPPPDCAADFDDDDIVGASDLLQLLEAWGPCTACEEDLDDNGTVGASDLLILLASWGSCP